MKRPIVSFGDMFLHWLPMITNYCIQGCGEQISISSCVDKEIVQLLEGLPTSTTPTTPTFDTSEPSSYDTMLPTYSPRKHRMVPATHHRPLESVVQRYATMRNLQQPSAVQGPNFSVDQMAEALRLHGSIYPLHTLYNMHEGRLSPLQTLSEVRVVI